MLRTIYPFASWPFSYRREWLRADLVAGLTAAAVVIPKAMAYAVIAGLRVEAGLYAALAAMLVYPLLGSSRPLSVTTTSALAMLTMAGIGEISAGRTGVEAASAAATLSLLVGGILVLARLFRLGFAAKFISKPVLIGFEAGVGIVDTVGQLGPLIGVHVKSTSVVGTLLELPGLVPGVHLVTVLVALAGIGVLLVTPRLFPRLSAPLVWLALSIGASALLGLGALGVPLVGEVPAGLPSLALPDLSLAGRLWPAALGIALMSFTESVAAARTFCRPGDPPIDSNQELLAVGAANVASALVGGLPAGGGTSQTAVADSAGARSQLAQWVNAGVVLVSLLFLSRVIALLPKAALGAVIVLAAISMIKPAGFRAVAHIHREELLWSLATLAGVVLIGTLQGILIAVGISILTLMVQANHPPVYAVAYDPKKGVFHRAGEHEDDETYPGFLMLRTEGRLTFANAENAGEKMQRLLAQQKPRVVVLECSAIPDIEYTALAMLMESEQKQRANGVELWLAAINPDLLATIRRSPLSATLGPERMFIDLHKALEAWQCRGSGISRVVDRRADRA